MAKYPHFELGEFIRSDTAQRKKIDNTPTFEIVEHLEELISTILEPMRVVWGSGITISSGYRCPALNKVLAGSSDTSVHMLGYAADLVPTNGKLEEFIKFVPQWLKIRGVRFDQCLVERSGNKRWVHIGLYNNQGQQRGMIRMLNV